MKSIDIRLKPNETTILKSFIGNKMHSYQHDEFNFTPTSSQAVSIAMDGDESYYLYSFTEVQDYFGTPEDVAVWSFTKEKLPIIDHKSFISTPVDETIKGIKIIQENQRVYRGDEQTYDVWVTRGIIFDLGDREIAFEKDTWFSEQIIVHRGYDLISQFAPAEKFGEDWDTSVRTEFNRTVIEL